MGGPLGHTCGVWERRDGTLRILGSRPPREELGWEWKLARVPWRGSDFTPKTTGGFGRDFIGGAMQLPFCSEYVSGYCAENGEWPGVSLRDGSSGQDSKAQGSVPGGRDRNEATDQRGFQAELRDLVYQEGSREASSAPLAGQKPAETESGGSRSCSRSLLCWGLVSILSCFLYFY